MTIDERCDEILKRSWAMLHTSPNMNKETAKEMLEKIHEHAILIKKEVEKHDIQDWGRLSDT